MIWMDRKWKTKTCLNCGKEYLPTNGRQKWCVTCRPGAYAARQLSWQRTNPDKVSMSDLRWRIKYPEKVVAHNLARRISHPAEDRVWAREHPEQHKIIVKRCNAHRRTLGFNPLNSWFPGCEAHHTDKNHVLYMPKELHQSIRHNVFTGRNMECVNILAKDWLTKRGIHANF